MKGQNRANSLPLGGNKGLQNKKSRGTLDIPFVHLCLSPAGISGLCSSKQAHERPLYFL